MKTDLLCIPGIGKNIRQDLINIGIDCVEAVSYTHLAAVE